MPPRSGRRSTGASPIRTRVQEWSDLLGGHLVQARQILKKLVVEPLVLTPQPERRYQLNGRASIGGMLEGIIDPIWVASPTGTVEMWNVALEGHDRGALWSNRLT